MTTPLRIALPKGRLLRPVLDTLAAAGIVHPDARDPGRRLVLPFPGAERTLGRPVEAFLLKNADVPVYVEHGVADIGVSGTDVLDEAQAHVLRPHTFPFGRCRISVATRNGTSLEDLQAAEHLRIASKYTHLSRRFLREAGWNAELIRLGGSVELGAVLGLADAIIDLVETGRTLRENHLHEVHVIGETRVKLIANRALGDSTTAVVQTLLDRITESSSPAPEYER
ncbi:MAG: ATP phosphoribosyltransferase [Deltaproteobacteria bacterium]|nr:MAG: ATP phosphoribosyltransferase [Deltaproteobacteria bacterium]